LSSAYDTAYNAGLNENYHTMDEKFSKFLTGDGTKFSNEVREQIKKEAREGVVREVLENLPKIKTNTTVTVYDFNGGFDSCLKEVKSLISKLRSK